jgi:hypothetical protein
MTLTAAPLTASPSEKYKEPARNRRGRRCRFRCLAGDKTVGVTATINIVPDNLARIINSSNLGTANAEGIGHHIEDVPK